MVESVKRVSFQGTVVDLLQLDLSWLANWVPEKVGTGNAVVSKERFSVGKKNGWVVWDWEGPTLFHFQKSHSKK